MNVDMTENSNLGLLEIVYDAPHNSWNATKWHFGKDSYKEYPGEKFEVIWEDGQNALMRINTKDLKAEWTRIRRERQEYPNKRFDEAMNLIKLSGERMVMVLLMI